MISVLWLIRREVFWQRKMEGWEARGGGMWAVMEGMEGNLHICHLRSGRGCS